MARGKYKRKRERKLLQAVPISDLGFGTRLENTLAKAGLHTLADLSALTAAQLKSVPGLGDASYATVCGKLTERGMALRQSEA